MATPPTKQIISDLETGHLDASMLTAKQRVQVINFYVRMARKWRDAVEDSRSYEAQIRRLKATIDSYELGTEVARAQLRDLELAVEKLKSRSKS